MVIVAPELREAFIEGKSQVRGKIFEKISEQKIDITVATVQEVETDPFLASVFPKAIHL